MFSSSTSTSFLDWSMTCTRPLSRGISIEKNYQKTTKSMNGTINGLLHYKLIEKTKSLRKEKNQARNKCLGCDSLF